MIVRRSGDRFGTGYSRHSFSFGPHYDPDNTHFGVLLAHNEDVIPPGGGYDTHPHRAVEIVTWVLAGELTHTDPTGSALVRPGTVQRLSAGRGVQHAERNEGAEPLHLVQVWVAPGVAGGEPDYAQADLTAALAGGGLVPVASGRGDPGAVTLNQPGAVLSVAQLEPGATIALPAAPFVHVFLARGDAVVESTDPAAGLPAESAALSAGDAVRLTAGATAVAGSHGAELLVWSMAHEVGG